MEIKLRDIKTAPVQEDVLLFFNTPLCNYKQLPVLGYADLERGKKKWVTYPQDLKVSRAIEGEEPVGWLYIGEA